MKNFLIAMLGMLLTTSVMYSQSGLKTWVENFDNVGSITTTGTPAQKWKLDALSVTSPNSLRGILPNDVGDFIVLETEEYDFSNMYYIIMSFHHICKINAQDKFRMKYLIPQQTWKEVPADAYMGKAENYGLLGFSSASYPDWQSGNDITMPDNSWWKEETFDMSYIVQNEPAVKFRFIFTRQSGKGANIAYGWLIDSLKVLANPYELRIPVVEFIDPKIKDTIYNAGPYTINAKVKTRTTARIRQPLLEYTVTEPGEQPASHSILMTNVAGDSLWAATIPSYNAGTYITYSITGKDTLNNEKTIHSSYHIKAPQWNIHITDSIEMGELSLQSYNHPFTLSGNDENWSRTLYRYSNLEEHQTGDITILGIAYYPNVFTAMERYGSICYIQSTTDTVLSPVGAMPDPVADGAIRVFKGDWEPKYAQWNPFIFDKPFVLPAGENLLVTWIDTSSLNECGLGSNVFSWHVDNCGYVASEYGYSNNNNCQGSGTGTLSRTPSTMFYTGEGKKYGSYSVALSSIDNPTKESLIYGADNPIEVTISNRGSAALDSVTVFWQANGRDIDSSVWKGKLAWDNKVQYSPGDFRATDDIYNTLKVWVAYPNGHKDSITHDDTLSVTLFGCNPTIFDRKIISKRSEIAEFSSIDEALGIIRYCVVDRDITLILDTGTYEQSIDLTDISNYLGQYSLTITSITGNAEDVIIRPTSGSGITLNNSHNITIKAITVDISQSPDWGASAIYFRDGCDNILIRDCRLLAGRNSWGDYVKLIDKANFTNTSANNISIINNLIDGGEFGIHFAGCTEFSLVYGNNIVIDSNTITNWYNGGLELSYANLNSCSYNRVEGRSPATGDMYSMPTAVSFNRINGPIVGNRIKMFEYDSWVDYSTIGVSLENYNSAYTADTGLFANNEIITHNNGMYGDYGGLFIKDNTRVNVINNSIHVDGVGKEKGICISSSNQITANVRNNNIVTKNKDSYAVYLAETASLSQCTFDYNNMVSPVYIGYTGGESHSNITSWKSVVTSDNNSVSIDCDYIDVEDNLKIANYKDYRCLSVPPVNTDIEGTSRTIATAMGCYSLPEAGVNGILVEILGLRGGVVANQSDNLELVIFNGGTTAINSFNIEWSVDGTSKGATTHTITLAEGEIDTVPLGVINYALGEMNVKAWINNLGSLPDEVLTDDTLSTSIFVCDASLGGIIHISDTSTYSTIGDALETASKCGVSSDITFVLATGEHNENIDLSNINTYFGGHSLTITSKTGQAEDVIIRPSSGSGITLNNSDKVRIQAITVDVNQTGASGIQFMGACTNVVIRDCRLFADSTITSQSFETSVIYKDYETGVMDSIYIINNFTHGGSYGMHIYGGTEEAYSNHVVFDSNTVTNWYHNGIFAGYVNFANCSNNTILTRTGNHRANTSFFYIESARGAIIGNRFIQRSTVITYPSMIYITSYASNPDTILIANNEIIGSATANSNHGGIFVAYFPGRVNIINNSIYMGGTRGRGIFVNSTSNTMSLNVQNNNIVTESTTSYPIHLNSTTHLSRSTYDYNNMYSPSCVGRTGTTNRTTIEAWQGIVTSDKNSKSLLPDFVDPTINLELEDYVDFPCPVNPLADKDINGYDRIKMTTMGAYSTAGSFDLRVLDITRVDDELVNNQKVEVGTRIMNGSTTDIDSVTFRWSINDVIQPKLYTWKPSSPMIFGEDAEVFIDTFTVSYTDEVKISIWAENVNGTKDSIAYNDTVTKVIPVVPIARFVDPLVPDTIQHLSFNIYAKIMDVTGATIQTPKINLQTVTSNGIVYDTIDMIYGKDLIWVAPVPEQYYDSKVIYSLTVSDTIGNMLTLTDSTIIPLVVKDSVLTACNLSIISIEKLVPDNVLCIDDYAPVRITVANAGFMDYDFSFQPVKFYLEVTQPRYFYKDTIISEGILDSAGTMVIELTDMLPIITAGQYDVKTWLENPIDIISHDDTLLTVYVSGKFGLPVDEDFNSLTLPDVFKSEETIGTSKWEIVAQGTGIDAHVFPQEGAGMLAFSGNRGDMSTLKTHQLDLSSAIQPYLSFWYFHDTIPCDEDMDVRITVDGGDNYTTLFSIPKYDNHYYGWKQYDTVLPSFAINQCVVLAFEAMERSLGTVTQYLDHIVINAKQEIEITDILIPNLSVCNLKGKEWKVVLENKTSPDLDYTKTPLELTLELVGTSQSFVVTKNTGVLKGFSFDTIIVAFNFDFTKGEYIARTYISSIIGDVFMDTIDVNPKFAIEIEKLSDGGLATAGVDYKQKVTITNTGNMDLPNIDLELSVDTAQGKTYFTSTTAVGKSLAPGESTIVEFPDTYAVPYVRNYDVNVYGYLSCDPAIADTNASKQETVNMEDVAVVEITSPAAGTIDAAGSEITVSVKIKNRDLGSSYIAGKLHAGLMLTDADGNFVDSLPLEELPAIGSNAEITFTFTGKYTVPQLEEYYLLVYIQRINEYTQNDTAKTLRRTSVNISERAGVTFSLEQNIPNPAKDKTVINYSVPQDGEINFKIFSVNGQILYNKIESVPFGEYQMELNLSGYASGIYFYTMEYKGQKLTKQMSIKR